MPDDLCDRDVFTRSERVGPLRRPAHGRRMIIQKWEHLVDGVYPVDAT
jgi:hypothetical protein